MSRLTLAEWAAMLRDPVRDRRYRQTLLGPDIVRFLEWMELERKAERTRDQYERDLALGCLLYPDKPVAAWQPEDVQAVLVRVPPGSRKRVRAAWSSFLRWAYLTRRRGDNPIERVPRVPATQPGYIETFTPAEVEALLALPAVDGALFAHPLRRRPAPGRSEPTASARLQARAGPDRDPRRQGRQGSGGAGAAPARVTDRGARAPGGARRAGPSVVHEARQPAPLEHRPRPPDRVRVRLPLVRPLPRATRASPTCRATRPPARGSTTRT